MTILEMIAEWRKGCSCAEEGSPEECRECTAALIAAIEVRLASEGDIMHLLARVIKHADYCNGNSVVAEIVDGKSKWTDVEFTPSEMEILKAVERSIK